MILNLDDGSPKPRDIERRREGNKQGDGRSEGEGRRVVERKDDEGRVIREVGWPRLSQDNMDVKDDRDKDETGSGNEKREE